MTKLNTFLIIVPGRPGALSFLAVDAAARLLVTLVSAHGGGASLLARALSVMTAGGPLKEHALCGNVPACTGRESPSANTVRIAQYKN